MFSYADMLACLDDTLPPDHIKLLSGGEASVFKLDGETESADLVARRLSRND
jgi:hypothetical protein